MYRIRCFLFALAVFVLSLNCINAHNRYFSENQFLCIDLCDCNKNLSLMNSFSEQKNIFIVANVISSNYLYIIDTSLVTGNSYDIEINLANDDDIQGIQFDINFPNGFSFDMDNLVGSSLLNNFNISVSSLGDNTYRILIYSFGNNIISSGNEVILNLPVFVESSINYGQYSFEFSNVILSGETNQNISSEALSTGYVYIIDITSPEITLLGDTLVTITLGSVYEDAGATALDNYDGDITSDIIVTGTVDNTTLGSYILNYDVTDSNGNTANTVSRTINVVDITSPEITLLGDALVTIPLGSVYEDAGATAFDNYDGEITSDIIVTGTVDNTIVGDYTLSYDVTDSNGNAAATVTRAVTVIDVTTLFSCQMNKSKIYPNPSSNYWHIQFEKIINSIKLIDIRGKVLSSKEPNVKDLLIKSYDLKSGLYFIIINDIHTFRLIKE